MSLQKLEHLLLEHSVLVGDFILASGEKSDIYVDVRRTALRGDGALEIGREFLDRIDRFAPGAIGTGGLTLGADPLVTATSIAAALAGRPEFGAVIVRKEAKGHGTGKRVEQPFDSQGRELVVVDDVVTTAGSTLEAIDALRQAGYAIEHALCVVDREAGGRQALAENGVELHALFTLDELVRKKRAR